MSRKNRSPEENARREKIRKLLQMANIGSMDDIQNPVSYTHLDVYKRQLQYTLASKVSVSRIQI